MSLTVGEGARSFDDVGLLLRAGTGKVSTNTAAIEASSLSTRVTRRFGDQVLALSVDAHRCPSGVSTASGFKVIMYGGRTSAGISVVAWAMGGIKFSAGEILLNSMDADGVTRRFDTEPTDAVR